MTCKDGVSVRAYSVGWLLLLSSRQFLRPPLEEVVYQCHASNIKMLLGWLEGTKIVNMRRFLICLFFLTASVLTVTAGDDTDFLQQTKGWEWLFTEKSDIQRVTYPIETNYRVFENHPDYRVRGRFVYDKTGNLKRVSYLLSTYYEKWNLHNMLQDYNRALDTLVSEILGVVLDRSAQIVFPKKCKLSSYYEYPIFVTADFRKLTRLDNLASPNDNPLPQELYVKIGQVSKENSMPLAQKKLKEVEMAVEQANQDTSTVMLYMVENGIYARCNHEWLERKRNKIFEKLQKKAAEYCDKNDFQLKHGYEKYWEETNEEYRHAELWIRHALVVEDYKNNKYNVRGRLPEEALVYIEETLGIREKKAVVKDKEAERREMMTAVCEMLGIKYQDGINMQGMYAQLKKMHPTWSSQYIIDQITQTTFQVSMILGLNEVGGENKKQYPEADKYLAQLRADHDGEYKISNVERMDDVTFKIHFDTKATQRYAIIVKYYSDKPFSFNYKYEVVKD